MNLLIIEDDMSKIKKIKSFIEDNYQEFSVNEAHSYQSGMKNVLNFKPDVILLDMSLPTYDVSPREQGGRPRSFGGRDILYEIKRKKMSSRAIIVTQFEDFRDEKESKKSTAQHLVTHYGSKSE